jgi:hypothetical protein
VSSEVHEHYDANNNLVGTTVVTRESPWDDASRGRALRLDEYESSICGCGCNLPVDVAHDPTRVFMVEDGVCYAGRALDQVRDERAAARANTQGAAPGHGVFNYVRPHDPRRDPPVPEPKSKPKSKPTTPDGVSNVDQVRPGPPQR